MPDYHQRSLSDFESHPHKPGERWAISAELGLEAVDALDPLAGALGVAAFAAAAAGYLKSCGGQPDGTLSILLTGDEEGVAVNGTRKLVEWLQSQGTAVDHCLLGEPTSAAQLGDTIKVGRRGSLTADITLKGRQGHVAYPDKADNPVHRLLPVLARLTEPRLDAGTDVFQPSSLQITTIDVGNPTPNVIPGEVGARLNIRFNDWITMNRSDYFHIIFIKQCLESLLKL
jgi:succinyl-diaminopimelate desuccinylase